MPDPAPPEARQRIFAHIGDVGAGDGDAPAAGPLQSRRHHQKRRLARTGRPGQRHGLAGRHRQGHAVQDVDRARAALASVRPLSSRWLAIVGRRGSLHLELDRIRWHVAMMTSDFKVLLSMVLAVSLLASAAGPALPRPGHQDPGAGHQPDPGLWPAARHRIHRAVAGGAESAGHRRGWSINAGVSGDTTAGGLARLDWSLADHPDAVILELGSNDMLRGMPPAVTEKNLRAILANLQGGRMCRCC